MSAPRTGSYRVPWGRVLLGAVLLAGIAGAYATLPVDETLQSLVRRIDTLGPWADAVFVLVYAAASVLLQEVRRRAHGTACATAQVATLRERLLKLAAWVERSVRRFVVHLPQFAPWGDTWRRVAVAVGATPG